MRIYTFLLQILKYVSYVSSSLGVIMCFSDNYDVLFCAWIGRFRKISQAITDINSLT